MLAKRLVWPGFSPWRLFQAVSLSWALARFLIYQSFSFATFTRGLSLLLPASAPCVVVPTLIMYTRCHDYLSFLVFFIFFCTRARLKHWYIFLSSNLHINIFFCTSFSSHKHHLFCWRYISIYENTSPACKSLFCYIAHLLPAPQLRPGSASIVTSLVINTVILPLQATAGRGNYMSSCCCLLRAICREGRCMVMLRFSMNARRRAASMQAVTRWFGPMTEYDAPACLHQAWLRSLHFCRASWYIFLYSRALGYR